MYLSGLSEQLFVLHHKTGNLSLAVVVFLLVFLNPTMILINNLKNKIVTKISCVFSVGITPLLP